MSLTPGTSLGPTSEESGRSEVYVRTFPEAGRVQISANGGRRPIWDPDGKRIYFMEGNARMIVATITRDPALRFVSRSTLFEGRHEGDYDLAKDGRFLMLDIESANTSLVVIPNWRTELKRLTSSPAARRP